MYIYIYMDLRVTQSNEAFLNDVKSFEALKTNLINARLEAMKDIKDVYKIPKSQNMPLSQSLTLTSRILNQDDLIKIVDKIYSDLDANKFMTPDMREIYGQNLIFQWNQIVNKALRDNIISKNTLNDFNANVKANIRSFVSGLKGLNVDSPTTKEIKDEVESQTNQLLSELKKLEKQRQASMNVQEINQIDDKIMKLNQSVVSLTTLGIPLSDKLLSTILKPVQTPTSTMLVVPRARPAQQQSQPQSGIVVPETAFAEVAKAMNYNQSDVNRRLENLASDFVKLRGFFGDNKELETEEVSKDLKESSGLISFLKDFRPIDAQGIKDTLETLNILDRIKDKLREIIDKSKISLSELGNVTREELEKISDASEKNKKILANKTLFTKVFGDTVVNVTSLSNFLSKKDPNLLNELDKKKQKGKKEEYVLDRRAIVSAINSQIEKYGTVETYQMNVGDAETSKVGNKIVALINSEMKKLQGGYFVNPPSHTVEKYADTYNKPETKEQASKRMKKMQDTLQERNFTKISF